MKIRFIKTLTVGITEGEEKELPFHLAQYHIEKGNAEEVVSESTGGGEKENKIKRSKKEKNEEN